MSGVTANLCRKLYQVVFVTIFLPPPPKKNCVIDSEGSMRDLRTPENISFLTKGGSLLCQKIILSATVPLTEILGLCPHVIIN